MPSRPAFSLEILPDLYLGIGGDVRGRAKEKREKTCEEGAAGILHACNQALESLEREGAFRGRSTFAEAGNVRA